MEEERYYEDEISLKELIMALLNNWKLITAITLISVIIASGYVFVIADEVYESSIEGTISIPGSASTRYGSYSLPTTNKMDYLNMVKSNSVVTKTIEELGIENGTANGFADSITIETEEESTRFNFIITGSSPDEAVMKMETLVKNYLQETKVYFKNNALDTFISSINKSQDLLEENKEYTQMQLTQLQEDFAEMSPVITLQRLIANSPAYASEIAKDRGIRLEDITDEMMYEEVINPHYREIQGNIIDLQKSLQNIERAQKKNEEHLRDLLAQRESLDEYFESGDIQKADLELIDVIGTSIQFAPNPSYNESPVAPRKLLILAISLVLGGMIGVFAAFFKEYWQNSD
jgi:uncharacterized protein involved in exopolysaccharide biosynthesis